MFANQFTISSLTQVFPFSLAFFIIDFASFIEIERIKDFMCPIELERIDRLRIPIAINAIASAGLPASSPQKFTGVSNWAAFFKIFSKKLK